MKEEIAVVPCPLHDTRTTVLVEGITSRFPHRFPSDCNAVSTAFAVITASISSSHYAMTKPTLLDREEPRSGSAGAREVQDMIGLFAKSEDHRWYGRHKGIASDEERRC